MDGRRALRRAILGYLLMKIRPAGQGELAKAPAPGMVLSRSRSR